MTSEIVVDQKTYRIGTMSALAQFHVSRRLAPMLAAVGISLQSLSAGLKKQTKDASLDFSASLVSAARIMAQMTDEEVNYILFTCLGVVHRKEGEKWALVVHDQRLMYEDINMPGMLRLTIEVLRENLANFMPGLTDDSDSNAT
jgi:hypothetical protein